MTVIRPLNAGLTRPGKLSQNVLEISACCASNLKNPPIAPSATLREGSFWGIPTTESGPLIAEDLLLMLLRDHERG